MRLSPPSLPAGLARSYYANVSSNRWLALRLEAIGTCFVTFAALLAVQGAGDVSGGNGGLALTYSLSITQTLNWCEPPPTTRPCGLNSLWNQPCPD